MIKKLVLILTVITLCLMANNKVLKMEKEAQVRTFTKEFNKLDDFGRAYIYFYIASAGTENHEVRVDSSLDNIMYSSYSPTQGLIKTSSKTFESLKEGLTSFEKHKIDNEVDKLMKLITINANYKLPEELPREFITFLHEYGHSLTLSTHNMHNYFNQKLKVYEYEENYYNVKRLEFMSYAVGDTDNFQYDSNRMPSIYYRNVTWETMADRFAMEMLYENALVYTSRINPRYKATKKQLKKSRKSGFYIANKVRKTLFYGKEI